MTECFIFRFLMVRKSSLAKWLHPDVRFCFVEGMKADVATGRPSFWAFALLSLLEGVFGLECVR